MTTSTLTGSRLVLRPLELADAPRVVEVYNDPESRRWLRRMPDPCTLEDAVEHLTDRIAQHAAGTRLAWVATTPNDNTLLARANIFDIADGSAEIGAWAHPQARGLGIVTDMIALIAAHVFTPAGHGGLGLQQLRAYAAAGNRPSRNVLRRTGFTEVRRDRDYLFADGTTGPGVHYHLDRTEVVTADGGTPPGAGISGSR